MIYVVIGVAFLVFTFFIVLQVKMARFFRKSDESFADECIRIFEMSEKPTEELEKIVDDLKKRVLKKEDK